MIRPAKQSTTSIAVSAKHVFVALTMSLLASFLVGCMDSYEVETDWQSSGKMEEVADTAMISAARPEAVSAGLEILRKGGTAVDAAVAVQMVLNVAEPPESGIGGGAFMLYRDGATGELIFFDGREVAPASAMEDRFTIGPFSMPLWMAVPTGLSVGVPGVLAMLDKAHSQYGNLPWDQLFSPAVTLAEGGMPMPERLQRQIGNDPSLWLFRDTRRNFARPGNEDQPKIHNVQLAATLKNISEKGIEYFYNGELTDDMVKAAASRWPGPSDLVRDDFANYQSYVRDVVCGNYREWVLCGPPPPSSGGVAILQILGILEHYPMDAYEPGDPEALHLIAEASRIAFADRARYIGDPDFADVPVDELTDPDYLSAWAEKITPGSVLDDPFPDDSFQSETTGTSHFSIVDSYGNAVSMTTSIESPFGSRIFSGGFLLNNQLTDFTFSAEQNGFRSPNAVEPGKRPRSSMSPFMVFDSEGELHMVIGSRGGARIIGYVLKTLIGVIDWQFSLQQAIAMPNILHRGEVLELEEGTAWSDAAEALESMGHNVRVQPLESGVHGMERVASGCSDGDDFVHSSFSNKWNSVMDEAGSGGCKTGWRGGFDPRMEGKAAGY